MSVLSSIIDKSISGSFSSDLFFNVRDYAFYSCSNLISVSFPNATSIGDAAFRECSSLTSVSFPNVTSIGGSAFTSCMNLISIYVGTNTSTVCTLKDSAFGGCPSLNHIYVPASLVDSYKSATNWSRYASKIKAAP